MKEQSVPIQGVTRKSCL